MLDVQTVKSALPAHLKTAATQSLADKLNQISSDPEMAEQIGQNFISYTNVLQQGRFKTEDYLHAVAYVSYKLMGYSNQDAYARVFPHRIATLRAKGSSDKDISAYVSAYNKGKLVNLIYEQTLVPTWVLNAHVYQQAINTQARLMNDPSVSHKVQAEAANSILTHLKKPETKTLDVNIGVEETSGMTELKDMLTQMAGRQQELIAQGATTQEIAHQKLPGTQPVEDAEVVPSVVEPDVSGKQGGLTVLDEASEIPKETWDRTRASASPGSKPEAGKHRPSLFDVDPRNPSGPK